MQELTGSWYYRQLNCFASSAMSELARDRRLLPPETKFAKDGTRTHEEIEDGESLPGSASSILVAKGQDAFKEWAKTVTPGPPVKRFREVRFFIRDGITPVYSGKIDYGVIFEDRAFFQDYKSGHIADWATWDAQRTAYAVLLHHEIGPMDITGQIVPLYGKVNSKTFLSDNLEAEYAKLRKVIYEHTKENQTPTPGDWCKFCEGRLLCPKSPGLELSKDDRLTWTPIGLPVGKNGSDFVSRLKCGIKVAEEILEWYTKALTANPDLLAGEWKIREGAITAQISDPIKASKRLSSVLSAEEQAECATFYPGKIKKKIKEKRGVSEEEAEEIMSTLLAELLSYNRKASFMTK